MKLFDSSRIFFKQNFIEFHDKGIIFLSHFQKFKDSFQIFESLWTFLTQTKRLEDIFYNLQSIIDSK